MDHYTLNPIVEASDFVKIWPDGLSYEELVDLNRRAHVLASRLEELSTATGFMTGPERNNLNSQIRKIARYIARLCDLMSCARLAKMQNGKRSHAESGKVPIVNNGQSQSKTNGQPVGRISQNLKGS